MEMSMTSIALLLLTACSAAVANPTPIETVERFYRWAIGAGAQPDTAPVRGLISDELFGLLAAQAAHERACAAAAPPDEKPLMFDQNPFFLWPEGAQAFSLLGEERIGERVRVGVRLRYEELEWIDVAELMRERQHWVLHDLEWQESGLRERLQDFLSMPCLPDGEGEQ
jgi:hypothetical protein